jgi:leucyl aminopeptidase (aminopeptidase T)
LDILVNRLLRLQANEELLMIVDSQTRPYGDEVAQYASRLGAIPLLLAYERSLGSTTVPETVVGASRAADVVLGATTISLGTTRAAETINHGGRFFSCPAFSGELLDGVYSNVDLDQVHEHAAEVAELLTAAQQVRILSGSQLQHELLIDITGRPGHGEDGRCVSPGAFASLSLEAYIAPLEENAHGSLEFSVFYPAHGQVSGKTVLRLGNGRIVDIQGDGDDVQLVREALEAYHNDKMYHIAEFGIGLNNGVRLTKKSYIIDESASGTCHIAVGTNASFGGANEAGGHIDFIAEGPTVYIDDTLVLEQGELVRR